MASPSLIVVEIFWIPVIQHIDRVAVINLFISSNYLMHCKTTAHPNHRRLVPSVIESRASSLSFSETKEEGSSWWRSHLIHGAEKHERRNTHGDSSALVSMAICSSSSRTRTWGPHKAFLLLSSKCKVANDYQETIQESAPSRWWKNKQAIKRRSSQVIKYIQSDIQLKSHFMDVIWLRSKRGCRKDDRGWRKLLCSWH